MLRRVLIGWSIIVSSLFSGTVACPDGWVSFQHNCYFHQVGLRMPHTNADTYCRAQNSFLVDIQSPEENAFVTGLITPGITHVWTGYRSTATGTPTRDTFKWGRTGEVGAYTNWYGPEPNNINPSYQCMVMNGHANPAIRGFWYQYVCTSVVYQFVCKQVSTGVNVTVNCTANHMSFLVRKSLLNNAQASELRLNDDVCQPQESGDYLQYSWGLSSCGNTATYSGNKTIYANTIKRAGSSANPGDVITRENLISFTVLCSFDNYALVSSGGFQPIAQQTQFTESGFGTFTMSIQVTDKTYTNPVSNFPLQVSLNDYLYFKLNVQSSDSRLDLFAVSCYATPFVSPTSSPQYEFMREDCALDQTMFVNVSSQDSITFGIQAFQFIGQYTYVYVHCSLAVCHSDDSGNRCSQGCLQARRKRRETLDYTGASEIHSISQGPFSLQISAPASVSGEGPQVESGASKVGNMAALLLSSLPIIVAVF